MINPLKKITWGDELCGHIIDPKDWLHGISYYSKKDEIELNEWFVMDVDDIGFFDMIGNIEPVYPPIRWMGLSELEIWKAMSDDKPDITMVANEHILYMIGGADDAGFMILDGFEFRALYPDACPLIQMLQNANKLQKRLIDGIEKNLEEK